MTIPLATLKAQVRAQKTLIPALYGGVDFEVVPERFARDARDRSLLPDTFAEKHRARSLADADAVERMLAYTMLGDGGLVRRIDELLVSYGNAEYATDPSKYAVSRGAATGGGATEPRPAVA
ncbi:MAG: hypothetical protein IT374_12210 [Polyangiaceae bacterium]|nr:hypothetical protein [Polyangiaceae bacterium]